MRRYSFHWRDGVVEEGHGVDAADALRRLGYGGGALSAIDYYKDITTPEAEREIEDEILRKADAIRAQRELVR